MTCQQVQSNLSLYLYGELDFALEESLEAHVHECAFCQMALAREKAWHASLNAEQADVPLDLLASCRRDLERNLKQDKVVPTASNLLDRLASLLHFSPAWTARFATAGLLIIAGFGAGRWSDKQQIPFISGSSFATPLQASVVDPYTRIRSVQSTDPGRVRIVMERISETALDGALTDGRVRQALLSASRDASDPGIRVDSVEVLSGQSGTDVRNALLQSVQQDPNAAVRLKAVQGLESFASDPDTRVALIGVLKSDKDPSVRSAAIDVLLPARQSVSPTPDLLQAFQQIVASQPQDDYIRMRCIQAMQSASGSGTQVY